jgi:putative tributyrin esterase
MSNAPTQLAGATRRGLVLALTIGAFVAVPTNRARAQTPGAWEAITLSAEWQGEPATGEVWVYVPSSLPASAEAAAGAEEPVFPLLVALPGWNSPGSAWRDSSVLTELAEARGFVVVAPSLGRSVYEAAYYEDTRRRWSPHPGLAWVRDVVVPAVRARLPVDRRPEATAVIGYSTGGRGAALLGATTDLFGFAASLSGTFDLTAVDTESGEYRIHAAVFGSRRRNPERWLAEDCPRDPAAYAGVRWYAAHGGADEVVPASQTGDWLAAMRGAGVPVEGEVVARAGHDWRFWNAQLPMVIDAWLGAAQE